MTGRQLWMDGVPVASYVAEPALDIRLGPRPYLHPVRTLGGVTVTDAFSLDHPWHLGASLAMPYVDGFNLWGGRSCLRQGGYTWRDDHGRIAHTGWDPGGSVERLRWEGGDGRLLLDETRRVAASPAPLGWWLSFAFDLTAPPGADVVLGSPATSGFPGAGGYGGFFWRAGPGVARAFTGGSDQVQGSDEPWVALTVAGAYTLAFEGLSGDDRWFVRSAGEYAGVCAALAYERPLIIAAGSTLSRRIRVLVSDGELTRAQINAALPAGGSA